MNESESKLCIVLRSTDYKDYDRILTLLSRDKGRITVMAKGAKSLKSKLNAATQPFCCADYEFYEKGDKIYLKSAEIKEKFSEIQTKDINKYMAASAMLELTEKIAEFTDDNRHLFALLIHTLYALNEDETDFKSALTYYIINIIYTMGVFPSFDFCVCCGDKIDNAEHWNIAEGGAVCGQCAAEINCDNIVPSVPAYFNAAIKMKPLDFIKAVRKEKIPEVLSASLNYLRDGGDIELRTIKMIK